MAGYTIYDCTLSTLTPLHIGCGRELLNEYDYAIYRGRTWRIDENALLDAQNVDDPRLAEQLARTPPAQLLRQPDDFQPESGFFRYVVQGTPRSQAAGAQLREQIKDAFDRLYLPGTSLKGGIRTALAWHLWRQKRLRPEIGKIGRSPKWAGQQYEKDLLGSTPNQDTMRALQVSDSAPIGVDRLLILNVSVIGRGGHLGAPIEMEAIAQDTELQFTLKVDHQLFSDWAVGYGLKLGGADLLENLPRAVHSHSVALARKEAVWFGGIAGAERVADAYRQFSDSRPGSRRFLIPLGWGTGWESKTFGSHLQEDTNLMERLIEDFRMARGERKAGDPFPKSRRVAVRIDKDRQGRPIVAPVAPLGWCLVEMKERK
ncbi:MAG: type III-A CRISPR-associated RAMP protein Csm5 [Chloroflexi bacterium]|nr:MAG: type III-A CRISPR-associated RAMP protein Csm5 [Chloroflexota bacterium]